MHTQIVVAAVASFLAAAVLAGNQYDNETYVYIEHGKVVATNYTTVPSISKLQCVRQCLKERENNRCTIAGYNEATQACQIGWGEQDDLITVADNGTEVYHVRVGKWCVIAQCTLLDVCR